jgi:predicted ATPase
MEKARETMGAVSPDSEGEWVAEICTKLDDLASAIEVVASQVRALGIDKLSDLLDERWLASWSGRRMVPRRRGRATSGMAKRSRAPGDIHRN